MYPSREVKLVHGNCVMNCGSHSCFSAFKHLPYLALVEESWLENVSFDVQSALSVIDMAIECY